MNFISIIFFYLWRYKTSKKHPKHLLCDYVGIYENPAIYLVLIIRNMSCMDFVCNDLPLAKLLKYLYR